jgi:hypothetical protein
MTPEITSFIVIFILLILLFSSFAENSDGNVIFLDGSTSSMEQTMKQLMSLNLLHADKVKR